MQQNDVSTQSRQGERFARSDPFEILRKLGRVNSWLTHWARIEQLVESRTMADHMYKVIFVNQGEIYEIYARKVSQGGLFGFVEVEELAFGQNTKVVIDPSQERLEREFEGVKRVHLPMHSVVRIDEVEKPGVGRISTSTGEGNLRPFPTMFPPKGDSGGGD